jgi:SAM-dependent methyltransferase
VGGPVVVPPGVDTTKPNIARMYDYLLGGKDNFGVDREVAEMSLRIMPDSRKGPRSNRAFLRRVVRYLTAEAGVRQFLDIGSGLPTRGNVHEIAQEIAPAARVVYVDNDPVVLAHARALLAGDHTAVVTADIREPESILNHPIVRGLIDFDRPVGLLMFAILHHVNDFEDPGGIAATFREAVPPGSHLAVSHFQNPGSARPEDAEMARLGEELFNKSFGTGRWRTPAEIRSYFGDWDLLEPGVVPMPEWRPDLAGVRKKDLTHYLFVGGVAKKL